MSAQRIEGEHPIGWRADQQLASGQDRRVLEARTLGTGRPPLAGVKDPGRRQTTDVLRSDLCRTRKSLSARVAAIARPFLGGGTGGESQRQQRDERRPQRSLYCSFAAHGADSQRILGRSRYFS